MKRNTKGQFIKLYTPEQLIERAKIATKNWQASEAGKVSTRNATSKHRTKRRQWLHEFKKTLECVYCGENNPLVIDMDHIDRSQKLETPAKMITGGYKWEDVMAEIKKCQPVCANCHRIKSILESDKMKDCNIDVYIPETMKHLRSDSVAP